MHYAYKNTSYQDRCYHDAGSHGIQNHSISMVTSNSWTEATARRLQDQLDSVYTKALQKGYALNGPTMVGAVRATVGSSTVMAVALSGANASAILSYIEGGLGADVAMIGNNVVPTVFTTILGIGLTAEIGCVAAALGGAAPPPACGLAPIPAPHYPVGACAGQKLIQHVVSASTTKKAPIREISMAEIFWKSSGKSNWSTGELVPSCNTCEYVIPMLLCNFDASGDRVPYP